MASETAGERVAPPAVDGRWSRFTRRQRIVQIFWVAVALIVVVYSYTQLRVNYAYVLTAHIHLHDLFTRMWPPNIGYSAELVGPTIETVHIAIIGTIMALIISLPVALLAAENTSPNVFTLFLGKLIVVASRSVPTIIWAIIFVVIFGAGALAGTVAIVVRSIGFCGKLLGEEIEEIDFGQVEAIRATGANELLLIMYAIAPQVKPAFIGIATYRWDINIRASTILGFVGAGGIGVQLLLSINFFRWRSVFMILIIILGLVLVSEGISAWARRKVR